MTGTRIDKWLWAARFFKTRALATKACDLSRVRLNGQPAKPAREVKAADTLEITNEGGTFTIEVLGLSEVRGPAPVAQALYRETEDSKALRAKQQQERKDNPFLYEAPRTEKPSRKNRRLIHSFRGDY